MSVRVEVNSQEHVVDVPEGWTLAALLRDRLGLTGTKVACGEGTCGSCTVVLDGRPVLSCLTLAAAVEAPPFAPSRAAARCWSGCASIHRAPTASSAASARPAS